MSCQWLGWASQWPVCPGMPARPLPLQGCVPTPHPTRHPSPSEKLRGLPPCQRSHLRLDVQQELAVQCPPQAASQEPGSDPRENPASAGGPETFFSIGGFVPAHLHRSQQRRGEEGEEEERIFAEG